MSVWLCILSELDSGALGVVSFFFFQAEDGIRDLVRSRGLGDVYKRQVFDIEIEGTDWFLTEEKKIVKVNF